MTIIRCITLALVLALAGACSTVPGLNLQGAAGVTDVSARFVPVDGKPVLSRLDWRDGKEKADITVSADFAKGTFEYTAKDVAAFDGQAFRAEVDKAQSEAVSDTVKQALPIIAEAVLKAFGVP